jgi:hypothetical protein
LSKADAPKIPSSRSVEVVEDLPAHRHGEASLSLAVEWLTLAIVFASQAVGIKKLHEGIWPVSFMDYDLGSFDLETRVVQRSQEFLVHEQAIEENLYTSITLFYSHS